MTTTAQRPARPQSEAIPPGADRTARQRTLLALAASALGVLPLKGLFSDYGWLVDVWISMLVVVGPAALIRLRRAPGALDIWPGIVLLIPWLTARFLPAHAVLGFFPTGRTWDDLSALVTNLHDTTRNEVAPIHTTPAVRLVVCALLALLAALVDLVAVVGRRGALAGVPLLVVYTVAGAVPRKPVSWLWFAFAAVAYLLLLSLDAKDDLRHWGRRVQAPNPAGRARGALSVAAPRIAVAAIAAAVVLPLLVPGNGRNLIANAFHGGNGGSGVGSFGGSGGGKLRPFAALRGQLRQQTPSPLATGHMLSIGTTAPFYLRLNVLSKVDAQGWGVDGHGPTSGIQNDSYPSLPFDSAADTVSMRARITSTGFSGVNPPVFANPTAVSGLSDTTTWSAQDRLLLGSELRKGDQYTIDFDQPTPTKAQLEAAPNNYDDLVRQDLVVPGDFPALAKNILAGLVAKARTPYDKALAIFNYFVSPASGFVYDLNVPEGDSGSALVDFLKSKRGFCQQYAAAMAVMLRATGVPARVVLGYMHSPVDSKGDFTVTTADAHSWVEAYFTGIGWIPFDPTPTSGLAVGAGNNVPWAPRSTAAAQPGDSQPRARPSATTGVSGSTSRAATPTAATPQARNDTATPGAALWVPVAVLVVLVLGLAPAFLRWLRRRRRYLAARRDGDPDALWSELSDTATDLGYVWTEARTPRQVASWLGDRAAGSTDSLQALAAAVEQRRYAGARAGQDPERLVRDLRAVTGELRSGRSRRTRLRAILWPASLGWTSRGGGIRLH